MDLVYGDDTEAFLDELVNDDFSDWHSSELHERNTEIAKHKKEKQNFGALLTAKDKNTKPTREVLETVQGEQPINESSTSGTETSTRGEKTPTSSKKTSTPARLATPKAPQKRWIRFPTRVPTAQDQETEQDKSRAENTSTSQDGVSSSIENNVLDASNLLSQLELQRNDDWEDERDSTFEERHRRMENYLENLRHESRKKRGMPTNTSSSVECSTGESPFRQDSSKTRYDSACTLEEVIDYKMKDVEEKFNNSICDAWIDDMELALMLIKRKSKGRNLKTDEAKDLVNNILEQK